MWTEKQLRWLCEKNHVFRNTEIYMAKAMLMDFVEKMEIVGSNRFWLRINVMILKDKLRITEMSPSQAKDTSNFILMATQIILT